jgi:ribulose kinase
MYHPFCLIEVLRSIDNCVVCGNMMHSNWWISWGMGAQSLEMQMQAESLKIPGVWGLQKVSMLQGFGATAGKWSCLGLFIN